MTLMALLLVMAGFGVGLFAPASALAAGSHGGHHHDEAPSPPFDLSLESRLVDDAGQSLWIVTVRNNPVVGQPRTEVRGVVVRFTAIALGREFEAIPDAANSIFSSGHFDPHSLLWTIPVIEPGGSAVATFVPTVFFSPPHVHSPIPRAADSDTRTARDTEETPPSTFSGPTPVHIHAEIVEPHYPTDPPGYEANDQTEGWYVRFIKDFIPAFGHPTADVGVSIGVSDRSPERGGRTTFEVGAQNFEFAMPKGAKGAKFTEQWDVRVKIEVSPGLSIDHARLQESGVTNFDAATDVWYVGKINGLEQKPSLAVPVFVTNDDIALEQRCLTATVVNALPAFELDPQKQENDVATMCLGEQPPVVVTSGDIILWSVHDCVGQPATQPCSGVDDLRLRVLADRNRVWLPGLQGGIRDSAPIPTVKTIGAIDQESADGHYVYLEPEWVIIQLPDPTARKEDESTQSVLYNRNMGHVSWRTEQLSSTEFGSLGPDSVEILYSYMGLNIAKAARKLTNMQRTVSVRGWKGGDAPGRMKIRESSTGNTLFDPNPAHTLPTLNLKSNSQFTSPSRFFFEFENLGTYEVNHQVTVTRKNGTAHSDSGKYVFHVGPISELAVWDGGRSPLAAGNQTAYTVVAANNGPDTAPDVQVTLDDVPEGVEAVTSEGTFELIDCEGGSCEGVWDIGELQVPSIRVLNGLLETATLTLIVPSNASTTTMEASIANTRDYTACVDLEDDHHDEEEDDHEEDEDDHDHDEEDDHHHEEELDESDCVAAGGQWRSGNYLDYLDYNDTATIVAVSGTGEGMEGVPGSVEVVGTSVGTLLRWEGVEELYGWPVSHYEVQRASSPAAIIADDVVGTVFVDTSASDSDAEFLVYRVRAVNQAGVVGLWSPSQPVGDPPDPGVTVGPTELTVAKSGAAAAAGYTVVLDSPPTGSVTVAVAVDDPNLATVDRAVLTFAEDSWNIPQRVTVTWVDANAMGGSDVTISHRVSGGGYDGVNADPVTVTMLEAVLDVSETTLTVSENGGEDSYTIALTSAPIGGSVIVYPVSQDTSVATVEPAWVEFDVGNWQTPRTVTVTGVADGFLNPEGARDTRISHRIRRGGGLPDVTVAGPKVTVTDSEQPGLEFDPATLPITVAEDGGTADYGVRLTSRPTSEVTITPSSDDAAVAMVGQVVLTFTPTNWMDYQTVTVTGVNDDLDNRDDNRKTVINHMGRGGGYNDVALPTVEVIVEDDEASTGRGSITVTRQLISEYGGTTAVTFDLGRDFTSSVIRLCLEGTARAGSGYTVRLAPGADVSLTGENTQQPVIEFGSEGARQVVVEFTAQVSRTNSDQSLVVAFCEPNQGNSTADVRSNVSGDPFADDTTLPYSVTILNGLAVNEGESATLPLSIGQPVATDTLFDVWIFAHHYGIDEQALPSHYMVPDSVTIAAGENSASLLIQTKPDVNATDGKFDVGLYPAGRSSTPFPNKVTVTILDKEAVRVSDNDGKLLAACATFLPSNAVTLSEVANWRNENGLNVAHALRWDRVLAALGVDTGVTPMTAHEANTNRAHFDFSRWDRTTATLEAVEQCKSNG